MAARPLVHGHRGARAVLPENTMAAFEYAIQIGADAVEMDVAVSSDNVPVISHDPHINSGLAIHQLAVVELKLPTLDQVLSLSPGNHVHFNIEIKSFPERPELTPPPDIFGALVLEIIQKHELGPRCIVQSFDFRILHQMKRLAPGLRLAALWEGAARPFVKIAQEAGAGI